MLTGLQIRSQIGFLWGATRSLCSTAAARPSSTNLFSNAQGFKWLFPPPLSLFQPTTCPSSPASSNSNARACSTVRTAFFSLVEIVSNSMRSSLVNVTLYRGAISSTLFFGDNSKYRSICKTLYFTLHRCDAGNGIR